MKYIILKVPQIPLFARPRKAQQLQRIVEAKREEEISLGGPSEIQSSFFFSLPVLTFVFGSLSDLCLSAQGPHIKV